MQKSIPSYIFLLLLISQGCQIDDTSSPAPGDTFLKYYGDSGTQAGFGMLYLEDQNSEVVIYGVERASIDATTNLFLLRVDASGNILDKDTINFRSDIPSFQENGAGDDTPGSLRYDPGFGFIYVGTSTRNDTTGASGLFDALVWAILDDNFDVQSQGEIRAEITQGDTTVLEFRDLAGADGFILGDTSLQIVGTTDLVAPGDPVSPVSLAGDQIYFAQVRLADGTVTRERTSGFVGNDAGVYIDAFGSNDIVIIGTTQQTPEEGSNVYLLPITNSGSPLDGRSATVLVGEPPNTQNGFNETVLDVYKRPNGYIVTGFSALAGESHPFFVNFNYSGRGGVIVDQADTVRVRTTVPAESGTGTEVADLDATGNGIALADNGNYFVVGTILNYPGKSGEMLIVQTNQFGETVAGSVRNYGLESGADIANDVVALSDGSVLVLTTVDFGGGNTLIGLMKVNLNGDLMQ